MKSIFPSPNLSGYCYQNGLSGGNNPLKENDEISLEIDMDKRTLHFFVKGLLQPVSYSNIPSPIKFYV
jgi:hypothetical protein